MPPAGMSTYSFKALTGAFSHPLVGDFIFAGKMGLGQINITMATDRTAHDTSADGSVMVSYISGDSGTVTIEAQQTSLLHKFLIAWYNAIKTIGDAGDPSLWAAAAMTLRNTTSGDHHSIRGISPQKKGDWPYAAAGGKVTWTLMAADIQGFFS